jgi:hypothetical protein
MKINVAKRVMSLMVGSLPPCEYLMVLQLISTTLQLRQAINGASAGRNIGLSLGVCSGISYG